MGKMKEHAMEQEQISMIDYLNDVNFTQWVELNEKDNYITELEIQIDLLKTKLAVAQAQASLYKEKEDDGD